VPVRFQIRIFGELTIQETERFSLTRALHFLYDPLIFNRHRFRDYMDYRRLITFCLVLAYLLLPLNGLAQLQPFAPSVDTIAANIEAAPGHCNDCPCSDEGHGMGGCDASCSCCSCFAPLPQGVTLDFSPVVTFLTLFESFQALPQVFLTIFVPPQNRI
jgi:hypothetical protein